MTTPTLWVGMPSRGCVGGKGSSCSAPIEECDPDRPSRWGHAEARPWPTYHELNWRMVDSEANCMSLRAGSVIRRENAVVETLRVHHCSRARGGARRAGLLQSQGFSKWASVSEDHWRGHPGCAVCSLFLVHYQAGRPAWSWSGIPWSDARRSDRHLRIGGLRAGWRSKSPPSKGSAEGFPSGCSAPVLATARQSVAWDSWNGSDAPLTATESSGAREVVEHRESTQGGGRRRIPVRAGAC